MKLPERSPHPSGVTARYVDVAHQCREYLVEAYTGLFQQFMDDLPGILLKLAEQAESNVMQAHCMDIRQEMTDHRDEIIQLFYNELMAGFENFILGKRHDLQAEGPGEPARKPKQLSLVEKETFEIELAFDTIANGACVRYSEALATLNLRLAAICGGRKPGERSAALPGSPHHICNAYRSALTAVQIPIDTAVKISLIEAIEEHVFRQAGPLYKRYNEILIDAGILPNLESNPLHIPREPDDESATAQKPAEVEQQSNRGTETREEIIEQKVYQQISQLLQQRRGGEAKTPPSATQATSSPAAVSRLISDLTRQANATKSTVGVPSDIAYHSMDQIRAEFSAQISRLSEIIKQHPLNHTDADVIELVGMLFELVLNDPNLPDSVKALLSHLHTPYLKVALLDRKFFFKRRHPARRLLNLLTQAGTMCNAKLKNEQLVFNQMRKTVNSILTDFDDNIELFEELLQEFEKFLQKFQKQARAIEKRAIEKAKGQEKLREARQVVARELIAIIRDNTLPKAAEKLIFGPWSNLLVLLYLREGADSETRQSYLQVTRDIVWSVQPKSSPGDQYELKRKLPEIKKAIQEGLALLGDPEHSADSLLKELEDCHSEALSFPDKTSQAVAKPLSAPQEYPLLREIDTDDILNPETATKETSAEFLNIVRQLQNIKLGTWFEFREEDSDTPVRAKLSWYSTKTSFYIFVNQAGIQVAVKPLKKLARQIQRGNARILVIDKRPFVERTLRRIHTLLKQRQFS